MKFRDRCEISFGRRRKARQHKMSATDGKPMESAAVRNRSEGGLTSTQKARVERNRQKALLLKQARLAMQPYAKDGHAVKGPNKVIDTGAGFFIENDEEDRIQREIKQQPAGPVLPQVSDHLLCEGCSKEFLESFLSNHFDVAVCDNCRENEKYALITKTDAKKKFLLKDADFDVREPPLKFLLRRNPHSPKWGDMKLFLELQVQARAMEVWGEEERLQQAKAERVVKREKAKKKKFDKRVKELRMSIRSSTWRKDAPGHQHDYGNEVYNQTADDYSKTCKTCGHVLTFEKM